MNAVSAGGMPGGEKHGLRLDPGRGKRMAMKTGTHTGGRSPADYLALSVKGFCMGASDVVPGVSGGTMAFILGIYDELIDAIKSFDLHCLRLLMAGRFRQALDLVKWRFLLFLGSGILTAIFSLARVLAWLLNNKPVFIWSFFLGLIVASVVSVARRIGAWRPGVWISFSAGTLGSYFLVGLVPVTTPDAPWFLFLSGAVAICAMILRAYPDPSCWCCWGNTCTCWRPSTTGIFPFSSWSPAGRVWGSRRFRDSWDGFFSAITI